MKARSRPGLAVVVEPRVERDRTQGHTDHLSFFFGRRRLSFLVNGEVVVSEILALCLEIAQHFRFSVYHVEKDML